MVRLNLLTALSEETWITAARYAVLLTNLSGVSG